MKAFLVLALLLTGCATQPLVVDVSSQTLVYRGKTYPVSTARRGTGGKPRSYRTPLSGDLRITAKQRYHRYGRILRIGGTSRDGFRQDGRGILIHYTRPGRKTRGCVGVSRELAAKLHREVPIGTPITIRM